MSRNMTGRAKRKAKSNQVSESGNGQSKKGRLDDTTSTPLSEVGSDLREELVKLYKLQVPEDLYHFWEFCKELCPESPQDALLDTLGLRLVGPFDILAEAHKSCQNPQPNFHLHWRYFYDPPEFQTILRGCEETQHHMGYYRDSPDSLPSFVGENEAKKGFSITQMGDNLFAAVHLYLLRKRKERHNQKADGEAFESLGAKLKGRAEILGLSLEQKTKGMKLRDKKVVTKTFHGAGIVVPVDKNDVGYRELPETDAGLKKICKSIAEARNDEERVKAFGPLQEMITFVQFANDECDYGMGYELGIDLFCYGSHLIPRQFFVEKPSIAFLMKGETSLEDMTTCVKKKFLFNSLVTLNLYFYKVIRQLLPMAYSLLKRNLFGEILEAHLSSRSHDMLDQLSPQ